MSGSDPGVLNDPNPTLRAEYEAALAILDPQIRGLEDIATMSISADLLAQIQNQIAARIQRQTLIKNVINRLNSVIEAITTLLEDGYPNLPAAAITDLLFAELKEENRDLVAAMNVFTSLTGVAFDSTVAPVDVPQPVPSQKPT